MNRKVENWSLEKVYKERARISFPEYQRQPNLWPIEKKRLLIDSILHDIDIPKLYFNQTADGAYEVVDGQQRLWAIWEFLDNEYSVEIEGKQKKFLDFPLAKKKLVSTYPLQITVLDDAGEDYLRELFVRLQLGLLLITGEKLNASVGQMKEFVFKKLSANKFIKSIGIQSRRFAKETLAAQICINAFSRGKLGTFSRTRYEDLMYFFKEYEHPKGADLVTFNEISKEILEVLDGLEECFGGHAKQLKNRSYVLSIFLFFSEVLMKEDSTTSERKQFREFIAKLWNRLKDEAKAGIDRTNRELYSFESLLSSAPGEKYQIERRHFKLIEYFEFYKKNKKIKGDK